MSYYNRTYAYNSLSFITSKLRKPISKYLVYGNNYILDKESYKNKFGGVSRPDS
jgi:predicted MPP superfamily phosphohydrolase